MKKSSCKDLVIAITYQCNSKCRMCNIWRKNTPGSLSPKDYNKIPADLSNINITGGEPFLHPELEEIVKTIHSRCSRAEIIISSNGFASQLILKKTEKILKFFPALAAAISLDGLGEKHNEIRGVPDGYAKAIKTILGLKKLGVRKLKIGFTLGDYNAEELKKVYGLSKQLGLEFSLAIVHSSENYFGKENKINNKQKMIKVLDWLISQELSGWEIKRWARAYFAYGAKKFLQTGRRILPDYSGQANIFIDPFGKIYPCDVSSEAIGQLNPFMLEPKSQAGRPNWMICTARPAVKRHWPRAIFWILKAKLNRDLSPKAVFGLNF